MNTGPGNPEAVPHGVGRWRSVEGSEEYAVAYAAALRTLPEPTRTLDVPTSYGAVRAYEFRSETSKDAAPIVLLPGRSSGVPMWKANLQGLMAERVVYAIDALGDAGMSHQTAEIADNADQASWIDEALARLGVERAHLVGHSFGGYLAANYASRISTRIASLSLLEPVFVFQGLNWTIYLKSIPAAIPLVPKHWRTQLLRSISGSSDIDESDPVVHMISSGQQHYHNHLPQPARLTGEQLESWDFPVYLAMAENSSLDDPLAAAETARAHVKHLRDRIVPNATHSLPMEHPTEINRDLLDFMAAVDHAERP
jgi:pimeloyl-ACP methyl ester carboxylesterase